MKLVIKYDIPFVTIQVKQGVDHLEISNVLIDTGSAKSILSADILDAIGVSPEPNDRLKKVKGIGGTEIVYEKKIDLIIVGQCEIPEFPIQIGAMNYGFHINGILGMDFLKRSQAMIDLDDDIVHFRFG
jgi:hypothetical protein